MTPGRFSSRAPPPSRAPRNAVLRLADRHGEQLLFHLLVGDLRRQRPRDLRRGDPGEILAHRAVRDAQLPGDHPRPGSGTEMHCHQPSIRRMVSLLVGIPHSVRCNGAVNASAMLTCQTPPLPGRPSHAGGRLRQNGGRLQIGMLDGIRSEWWAPSDQNAWTASLGIRNMDYERAVKEALTEPGKIYAAYQTFWQYSSSNQILAMWQLGKAEPISTCPGWKRIGRNVKKGEAIALLMPVTGRKIDEESGEEQRRMFFVSRAGADPVTAPRFMDIDGKRYLWRELVERGKAQVKKAAIPEQPTLFAEHEDRRPPGERSAAGDIRSPSLFSRLGT